MCLKYLIDILSEISTWCTPYVPPEPEQTEVIYGLLYNWPAATDARGIAAPGSHIPTSAEWQTLSTYLGGNAISGGKLKETGLTYWNTPNTGATNEVGFNVRGVGRRNQMGVFDENKGSINIWSTTISYPSPPNPQELIYSAVFIYNMADFWESNEVKIFGFSIRLLKDSTTLTHGQTGTYTGNDGKVYRTICIGTQEWLADNLCETKFANGDLIPEVQVDGDWAALITAGMCA